MLSLFLSLSLSLSAHTHTHTHAQYTENCHNEQCLPSLAHRSRDRIENLAKTNSIVDFRPQVIIVRGYS